MNARIVVPALVSLSLTLACAGGGDEGDDGPFFTDSGNTVSDESGTNGDEVGTETGGMDMDTTTTDTDGESSTDESGSTDDTTDTGESSTDTTTDTTSDTGDTTTTTGGECMTPDDQVGTSCGQGVADKGAYAIGESNTDLPMGVIYKTDNGIGNGYEDWYRFDFPVDPNTPRPDAGTSSISFAVNDNNEYRFEVFRDCGAEAYGQGLAAEFGPGAPPLEEWSFNDLDPGMLEQADYLEMVPWPSTVWVRVFRFANDESCSMYQLEVARTP